MGLSLNLLDQLAFYGAYHNNKWNQLIHFVFVPSIVWTVLVWLSYTGAVLPDLPDMYKPPAPLASAVVFNAGFVVVMFYTVFYLLLDFVAGLTWASLVGLPLWLGATAFQQSVPAAWQWALGVHVFSWYMQIHPGHALLEGRKPALLDSLVQAFSLAPLFVWYEALFLLGYRPHLRRQLQARVNKELAALRAGREPLLAEQQQQQQQQ